MNELEKLINSARDDLKKIEDISGQEEKSRQRMQALLGELNSNIEKWQAASKKVAAKGGKQTSIKSIEAQVLMKEVRKQVGNLRVSSQELDAVENTGTKPEESPAADGFSLVSDMF